MEYFEELELHVRSSHKADSCERHSLPPFTQEINKKDYLSHRKKAAILRKHFKDNSSQPVKDSREGYKSLK